MNVLRSKNLWKLTFGPGQLLVDGMIERFLRQPTQRRGSLRSEADGIWTAVPRPARSEPIGRVPVNRCRLLLGRDRSTG